MNLPRKQIKEIKNFIVYVWYSVVILLTPEPSVDEILIIWNNTGGSNTKKIRPHKILFQTFSLRM